MASNSKNIAELLESDGDVITAALDNIVVTPTAVSDKPNTSTGGLTLPAGTTAQRPSSPDTAESRFNSTTGSLEYYDGAKWISTNLIPNISSITGNIYTAIQTNLVFNVTNNTDTVDVVFSEGGVSFHTVSGQSVSSGAFTLAIPSQVHGQTAGDTISISIKNSDGTPSQNALTKTVIAPPSGGTISTSGNYRIHTFNSSSNFVVNAGFTANVETLIIAGGGGGGLHSGGGGGAGGLLYYGAETPKTPNGSAISVTAQTYGIVVGAGGAGSGAPYNGAGIVGTGFDGANSSALGHTTIGGGGGGSGNGTHIAGRNGGSGGGGSRSSAAGSGTSGQGNAGGFPNTGVLAQYPGGGGGGAGAVGGNGSTSAGGPGGIGLQYSISGSATYYAGGGGGTLQDVGGGIQGAGGNGGGGNGIDSAIGQAGTVNTGGGGGGGHYTAGGGAGGSGKVIIRYVL